LHALIMQGRRICIHPYLFITDPANGDFWLRAHVNAFVAAHPNKDDGKTSGERLLILTIGSRTKLLNLGLKIWRGPRKSNVERGTGDRPFSVLASRATPCPRLCVYTFISPDLLFVGQLSRKKFHAVCDRTERVNFGQPFRPDCSASLNFEARNSL